MAASKEELSAAVRELILHNPHYDDTKDAPRIPFYLSRDTTDSQAVAGAVCTTLAWRKANLADYTPERRSRPGPVAYEYVGCDDTCQPIVWMRARFGVAIDGPTHVQQMAYALEDAIYNMKGDTKQWTIVVDCREGSHPSIQTCRHMLDIFKNHYPKRLGSCYLIYPTFAFRLLWRVMSILIPTELHDKFHFLSTEKTIREALQERIGERLLYTNNL
jgi:hypothetical protein